MTVAGRARFIHDLRLPGARTVESFLDEAAPLAGRDPVEFRLAHLGDPRGRRVLERAAATAGWGS